MTQNRSPKQWGYNFGFSPKNAKSFLKKRHLSLLGWGTGVLAVGLGGGIAMGWFLIQRNLTPIVEREISDFLNRPVQLGSLQSLSFNHVRFGQTDILTTPSDPGQVSMSALEIAYNPIKFLLENKLEISITAVEPDVYLAQGKGGNWLLTEFDSLDPKNPIKLNSLQFKKADVTLVAYAQKKEAVELENLSGNANFNPQLTFEVAGKLEKEGSFQVSGITD